MRYSKYEIKANVTGNNGNEVTTKLCKNVTLFIYMWDEI